MEADSEQSMGETAASWTWSLPEEDCLTRLMKKHKKRVEEGEIPQGILFDEVSVGLNGLGFGIQRTSAACNRKWRRMCDSQSMLRGDTLSNGSNWKFVFGEAADFITDDEDEVDKGPIDLIDKNQKTSKPPWSEEESRTVYEESKTLQELNNQGGSPKFTNTSQLFNQVSALHRVKGYPRSSNACNRYWETTGRELWDYYEQIVGDFKTKDALNAKCTEPISGMNDTALRVTKNSGSVLTKSQISVLSQLATESLNPSTEQKEKVAKDHGISVFRISAYFANKRSSQRKEMAKHALDHESSKRKQSGRLDAEFADGNESIVARADDALRDTKKPRLSSSSQMVPINDNRSAQEVLAIEKDALQDLTMPALRSTTSEKEFGSSYAPIEIDSPPLQSSEPRKISLNNGLYTTEFKEAMLTQRRLMEEQITELTTRKEKLLKKALAHKVTADLEIEAYTAVQKKVVEEENFEAVLRAELKRIKDWEGILIHK
ncbi:uncharacterized protein EAF01_007554 [Botrytis porri]|uniref:Homeobox domain-containing protein n=1 Tax=Botrytis porri TaxID=87229 RepID=A0A4Z1KVY6_9HELO|nr:uncharacterized protein EAF01_007554 [Botrytis porri]KAF7900252.1 hypothetical protein EAF01_007554 [Botrytis porri]TGO88566.1 hypothetical protein BPOR_0154g00060 [Botrytis porri]